MGGTGGTCGGGSTVGGGAWGGIWDGVCAVCSWCCAGAVGGGSVGVSVGDVRWLRSWGARDTQLINRHANRTVPRVGAYRMGHIAWAHIVWAGACEHLMHSATGTSAAAAAAAVMPAAAAAAHADASACRFISRRRTLFTCSPSTTRRIAAPSQNASQADVAPTQLSERLVKGSRRRSSSTSRRWAYRACWLACDRATLVPSAPLLRDVVSSMVDLRSVLAYCVEQV